MQLQVEVEGGGSSSTTTMSYPTSYVTNMEQIYAIFRLQRNHFQRTTL
jgi:hypothetical protein